MYRGEGGLKCPVGFLLTDEEASKVEGMEAATAVWEIERLYAIGTFLQGLQDIHDIQQCSDWPRFLRSYAHKCKVSDAVIDKWEIEKCESKS